MNLTITDVINVFRSAPDDVQQSALSILMRSCKNGHLLDGNEYVYHYPSGTVRRCKTCQRDRSAAYYASKHSRRINTMLANGTELDEIFRYLDEIDGIKAGV